MPWVRYDDDFYDDPRVADVTLAAVGLAHLGLIWSTKHLKDGWVPSAILARCAGAECAALTEELVRVALLSACDRDGLPGYQLAPDLVALQPNSADVERERAAWRQRQRRARRVKKNITVTSRRDSVVSHGPVTPVSTSPVPLPVPHQSSTSSGASAPRSSLMQERERPTTNQLRKLVHEAMAIEPQAGFVDLKESVKCMTAKLGFVTDARAVGQVVEEIVGRAERNARAQV